MYIHMCASWNSLVVLVRNNMPINIYQTIIRLFGSNEDLLIQ